jgi:hypothetical protein
MPLDIQDPTTIQPLTNTGLSEVNRNRYTISQFQYPDDLGGADLPHFVQFNINVRGKSKLTLGTETRLREVRRDPNSAQPTEDQLAAARLPALVAGGAGAGIAAGALVSSFASAFSNKEKKTGSQPSGPIATAFKRAAPAIAGGGFAAAASLTEFLQPDTSYRISDSIALYVDGPPTVRYAAQYSNKELGTLAGLAMGGASGVASALNPTSEQGAALALKFSQIPQIAGINTQDIIGASTKVALNPFKEVLFEAIDFRTFSFKYRFLPKNRGEANAVYEIIRRFKFHMHPELSTNKLFFIYPSEFEISYFYQNKENTYFHKIKPCVLESMDVSYGGDQFSSFGDGKPTEVNMSLVFRETEIITKQQIKDGF